MLLCFIRCNCLFIKILDKSGNSIYLNAATRMRISIKKQYYGIRFIASVKFKVYSFRWVQKRSIFLVGSPRFVSERSNSNENVKVFTSRTVDFILRYFITWDTKICGKLFIVILKKQVLGRYQMTTTYSNLKKTCNISYNINDINEDTQSTNLSKIDILVGR